VDIDLNSASIIVDAEGVAPDTDIVPRAKVAVLHLTRNVGPVLALQGLQHDTIEADTRAINIQGAVEVHIGSRDDMSTWQFTFIQLTAIMSYASRHAGATSRGGMISGNVAAPPAFPAQLAYDFLLDSTEKRMPFYTVKRPTVMHKLNKFGRPVPGRSIVVNDMDDHPMRFAPLTIRNTNTNQDNFLYQLDTEYLFISAFVARNDQAKKIIPLAYVTWRAEWHAEYHWVSGQCIPYPVKGAFKVDPWQKGLPEGATMGRTGSSLADKIRNPTTDPAQTGNQVLTAANAKLFKSLPFWNLAHTAQWASDVPSTFWK
jgi:hypothetical protein